MKKLIAGIASVAAVASMTFASVLPANAQYGGQRGRYVMQYCQSHPRDRDCNDFRHNGRNWNNQRYQGWYNSHRNNGIDPGAAALFGIIGGAIIGGAIANGNNGGNISSHVARCEARFRSYDRGTDSYMGNDGYRHRCTL
ncbi:MAG TPA: BA14K family protein [Devosiaceae bacterium]|jgi:opacity protein-like surface antigen